MQIQAIDDKIAQFLKRKFRTSRSYSTINTYKGSLNRFLEFVRIKYNADAIQLLHQIKDTKTLDPVDVLDEYYSFLSVYHRKDGKTGYGNNTIVQYVVIAKEFLNNEGCKIYSEDMRRKFRLPKPVRAYEKGLTKEIIYRVIRLANRKLAAVILIACASGMRISEIVQLKMSDIDFTCKPTQIIIRAETTKTRETRITHLTAEATNALEDYVKKNPYQSDYPFLLTHEDRIRIAKKRLTENKYYYALVREHDKNLIKRMENHITTLSGEERFAQSVKDTRNNFVQQLLRVLQNIPELNMKNENDRHNIHFHAFRAWFKTQVTDAHQSDFAEALMGHKSLKLVYYRQNDKKRASTYLAVEHALTIADTEKIDQNFTEMQKDNLELRGIVDSLSKQLRDLERKIQS